MELGVSWSSKAHPAPRGSSDPPPAGDRTDRGRTSGGPQVRPSAPRRPPTFFVRVYFYFASLRNVFSCDVSTASCLAQQIHGRRAGTLARPVRQFVHNTAAPSHVIAVQQLAACAGTRACATLTAKVNVPRALDLVTWLDMARQTDPLVCAGARG